MGRICIQYLLVLPNTDIITMSFHNQQHHRSPSSGSNSEPSQTHHHSLLPTVMPTPALVESVAGAAHYSGGHVDSMNRRHSSHDHNDTHTEVKADHRRVLEDIRELYECRPTPEIFERSWHKDAVFEDPLSNCKGFREYAAQWYAMVCQPLFGTTNYD